MRVCTMGRRLQRRVVAIALPLLLLLLPPPPAALSAPLPPSLIKFFSTTMKVQAEELGKSLFTKSLQYAAENIIKKLGKILEAKIKRGQRHEEEKSAKSAGLFMFSISVGMPWLQNVTGVLDITSELVWTNCAPCRDCLAPPAAAFFQPNMSDTFASVRCGNDECQLNIPEQTCGRNGSRSREPCPYVAIYSDGTGTSGHLANDTFTFGATAVPGLLFGCSNDTLGTFSGASGVFGFNRRPLSLVSQLQVSWFSYLWASDDDSGSGNQIGFGGGAAPKTQNSRSTSLITSRLYTDMYFVRLTGIKVDGKDLGTIPEGTFDFQPDGSGGVLLSTTMPITYLDEAAYCAVKEAIATKITVKPVDGSAAGLDLCYMAGSLMTVPKLALVFSGVDAVMNLQRHNYFFNDNESGLDCLTILPSVGGSVLGSLVQKGTNMTYDIAGQQLIFEQRAAASPAHCMESLMTMLPYYLAVWAMLF